MNKINLIISITALLLLSLSCSMMKDSKAAEPAIEKFHTQFNQKDFSGIYNDSGEELKAAATEKELTDLLDAVYRKLGTFKKSTALSWHVNAGPISSQVTLVFDTEFSDGKGTEQFLISVKGNDAKLEGYHINSNDLIVK